MSMKIADIYTRIGQLVSDPDLTEYADAIPNAFETSMGNLIRSGDFLPEEVPALTAPYEVDLTQSGISTYIKEVDISDLENVLRVTNVLDDQITFKKIEQADMNNIIQNPLRLPAVGEGYWYQADNKIYFIINEAQDKITNVMVSAVRNPNPSTWLVNNRLNDLVDDLHFGRAFIEKCIIASKVFIETQIAGEMQGE